MVTLPGIYAPIVQPLFYRVAAGLKIKRYIAATVRKIMIRCRSAQKEDTNQSETLQRNRKQKINTTVKLS